MLQHDRYETVVGLEVHAQLLTRSKLFSGDSTAFGADPNTQVSAISLAHPGTLPKMNISAIGFAVKMGLACHADIMKKNWFARKHYFYPDLPKGYQVSQHTTPICTGGAIRINTAGGEKHIRLNRIHLEEDAGKSIHDADENYTCIDLNRAGVPLIEIVTEPDLSSGDEAFSFLTELRKIVRYLGICDGNMEKGSLRCDANVSVRLRGEAALGTRIEIKNLNSIRNVKRAIEHEAARMIELVEKGEPIIQQTRSFDANTGTSSPLRDKEEADDYRYFADPDLTPFVLQDDFIEQIRLSIPALQPERIAQFRLKYNLPEYDATVLTEDRAFSDYFEKVLDEPAIAQEGPDASLAKAASNWMLGPVKSWLNEHHKEISEFPLSPSMVAAVVMMVWKGQLSFSVASTRLWTLLLANPNADPVIIAQEQNLLQRSDTAFISELADQVLQRHEAKVKEYQKGKKGLLALFVGEVMKLSKGKADPRMTNEILAEKLKSK